MDTFFEQIVPIKKTPAQVLLQLLISLVGSVMIFIFMVGALLGALAQLSILLFPAACVTGYFAWKLLTGFNVEYEYSVTNGYIDIDKIIAQRKRRRVLAAKVRDFEAFGAYDAKKFAERRFQTRIIAANAGAENIWYAEVRTEKTGHTLLVFEPDERILGAIKKDLPHLLAKAID